MSTDVWGTPRTIRTDEYGHSGFSQSYLHSYFNDLFGNKPADMFIVKDAPVLALPSCLGQFHWGISSAAAEDLLLLPRLVVLSWPHMSSSCISNDRRQEKHKGCSVRCAILIACAPQVVRGQRTARVLAIAPIRPSCA